MAENIKVTKESLRMDTLKTGLQEIHCHLKEDDGTCLPLSPSKLVFGINVQTCAYFPSFTLPLKINFISCDNVINPAIFKVHFQWVICKNILQNIIFFQNFDINTHIVFFF